MSVCDLCGSAWSDDLVYGLMESAYEYICRECLKIYKRPKYCVSGFSRGTHYYFEGQGLTLCNLPIWYGLPGPHPLRETCRRCRDKWLEIDRKRDKTPFVEHSGHKTMTKQDQEETELEERVRDFAERLQSAMSDLKIKQGEVEDAVNSLDWSIFGVLKLKYELTELLDIL